MSDTTEKKYDDYVFVSSEEVSMLDPTIIKTASPFKDLFPVREAELDRVVESMKADGYDSAHPIILWAGHNVTVIDGHTRLAAAKKLLFAQIPVIHKEFKDEAEALEYAIKSQRNRRNLTDADLLRCVTELDKRMKEGRPGKTATNLAVNGRSSENTAKLLGTSRGKVEKIRTINDHASDEVKEAVKSGKLSVNKAYNETQDTRKQEQFETEEDLMLARQTTLQDSICGLIRNRIQREMKKYPGSPFSEEASAEMLQAIIETIKNEFKHITRKGND
ncbi:MAG: ParB N-terminal domain-containing protein [Lentisphaeria bacterium]|nr:ParB N-terminal domain-containing protein [Lentisphaeria bacterium]